MNKPIDFHTHQVPSKHRLHNLGTLMPSEHPYSLGIHPWEVDEHWEDKLLKLEILIQHPKCFALGEIGFDTLKGPKPKIQEEAFQAQVDLAKKYRLPVILHCVKSLHLLQAFLKKNPDMPPIIWHGWNLKKEIANELLQYPIYFSFGRHIVVENSNAQHWLKECPEHKIFLETDDSNLPIASIYQQASVLLGRSMATLTALTHNNWTTISNKQWYE